MSKDHVTVLQQGIDPSRDTLNLAGVPVPSFYLSIKADVSSNFLVLTMRKSKRQSHDRQTVIRRLITLGLRPIAACSFADQVLLWAKSCGEEWCVSRLKDLKQQRIRQLAGLPLHPGLPQPKGAVKHLFRCSDRVSLDCLNIYTMFVNHGDPTAKQKKKFLGSMQKEPVVSELYEATIRSLTRIAKKYGNSLRPVFAFGHQSDVQYVDTFTTDHQVVSLMRTAGLESWAGSPSKRAPSSLFRYQTQIENRMSTLDHMFLVQNQPGLKMYPWDRACSEAYRIKSEEGLYPLADRSNQDVDPDFSDESWFGVVSFIQEAGYKLRAIANPVRPVQSLLSRLGFGLYACLKQIPNDFTHDHEAGVRLIQSQLSGKCTMYSVDLSDATNNLPLEPQLSLLKALGAEQWEIDLFHHSSRGLWSFPDCIGQRMGRWTVGQPLGLFPSFASFALMHHLICELALTNVMNKHHSKWRNTGRSDPWIKGGKIKDWKRRYYRSVTTRNHVDGNIYRTKLYQDSFPGTSASFSRPWAIIGDDIVIFDEEVYREYRKIIDALNVPVSEEKTLMSPRCAEFAKRIIFKDHFVLPHKWTPVSDPAIKAYLEKVGQKGLLTLSPRQRRLVERFLPLPEPFGLGWNPQGKPWEERVPQDMLDWYRKGTAPIVYSGDSFESSTTNILEPDIQDFWFVGTGLSQASASEKSRIPTRDTGLLGLFKSLRQCGLPVLATIAPLCNEHLVRRSGRVYSFDREEYSELFSYYQHALNGLRRRTDADQDIWPAGKAIRLAIRKDCHA